MALGEVGLSLPWWWHPLFLLAPGYWRLLLNLVLLFQNWKSKIHKVSSLLSKRWPFFCFLCSVEVDTFIKCMETSRILDFQFWNNNNVCFIKIRSKHNSNTLLNFLRLFLKQTLHRFISDFLPIAKRIKCNHKNGSILQFCLTRLKEDFLFHHQALNISTLN